MKLINNLDLLFDKERNNAGIAIRAIKNQNIVYEKCLGYSNIENKVPITTKSVFNLASISKQFTAFAIAILHEDGKLNYTDRVCNYIPEIKHYGYDIKISNLLYHSSGLIDYHDLLYNIARNNCLYSTNKECLQLLKKQNKLLFKPGKKFCYSNTNYVFLAIIIERITGLSFYDYLRKKIFIPLEMNNTYIFNQNQPVIPNKVYGYEINNKGIIQCNNIDTLATGCSQIYSSIEDLTKWDKALYSNNLLSKNNVTLITKPAEDNLGNLLIDDFWKYNYGFGWMLNGILGSHTMWHTGGDAGFRNLIVRFYEENFSIIMLSNLGNINWDNCFNLVWELYNSNK